MRSRGTALSQATSARFEFREKFCVNSKMKQSEKKAIWDGGDGKSGRHARSRPDNYTTLAAICQEFFAEKNHQISLVIFVQLYECFVKIDEF